MATPVLTDPTARAVPEAPCALRSPYQRDRDRIVHSKPFRRLAHKTQVFVAPEGDHYRTRLTHTLETTQISRTVARALSLDEDLVEAIGLGHDLGHPPFGHMGEEVLDGLARERFGRGFKHYEHSLRVVDVIEALNLTAAVRDGIRRHSGGSGTPATTEGRVLKLVDRIAYINHDIDDALRAGVISPGDLPAAELEILGQSGAQRIDTLVRDLVAHSAAAGDIVQGEAVGGAMLRLRTFMFERVYLGPQAREEHARIERVMRGLFEELCARPDELLTAPASARDDDLAERVIDHLAGMTDRYAIRAYQELAIPRGFAA